jgi:hypothetical protein
MRESLIARACAHVCVYADIRYIVECLRACVLSGSLTLTHLGSARTVAHPLKPRRRRWCSTNVLSGGRPCCSNRFFVAPRVWTNFARGKKIRREFTRLRHG